jgi:hypothetical protein
MRATLPMAIAAALLLAPAQALPDPASRCAVGKLKAAARKTASKLNCYTKAAARSAAVDPACLTKAEEKFGAAWARIEAKGGCSPTETEFRVEQKVDTCIASVVAALHPCGEVDGVCGGGCEGGLSCFAIGVGCRGEPEPCRCHGSTTTCPPSSTTSSTTSTTLP